MAAKTSQEQMGCNASRQRISAQVSDVSLLRLLLNEMAWSVAARQGAVASKSGACESIYFRAIDNPMASASPGSDTVANLNSGRSGGQLKDRCVISTAFNVSKLNL